MSPYYVEVTFNKPIRFKLNLKILIFIKILGLNVNEPTFFFPFFRMGRNYSKI